jgi:MFS family permease
MGGDKDMGVIVLFGGVLASLYSLLQFAFSPLVGSLSDRFGRRPVLITCIAGLAASYGLWFFASSFALLIAARILGGIMSGNISTATAVVADVTSVRNRPKGMAIIGMAFGIGFIIGPAIGGFSAQVDLAQVIEGSARWGVNPFSLPALIAFSLSAINLLFVVRRLEETRPESGPSDRVTRSANPLQLFRTEDYPGVSRTNFTNFLFLTAFSGTEFGLTFLATERFNYGPRHNAYLFVFIGIVLALVQGGYVRRRAPIIGPKRMATHGFVFVIPGVALVAFAQHQLMLYGGLLLMAFGSAQIIPCLTSLASEYTPPNDQGRVLGVFRSLGALARGVGPLVACVLYWQLGSNTSYLLLAIAVVLPLVLTTTLPSVKEADAT